MIKGNYDKEGCKTLAAAVINRAYKDLLNYKGNELKALERQILGGSLDLYLGVLNTTLTPEYIIKKARRERGKKNG